VDSPEGRDSSRNQDGTWTPQAYAFVQELYEQTWSHYRHLVSQRTAYLGYLFTASFGAVGVGVPLIVSAERLSPVAEIGTLTALLIVYQGFCLFVYASVRRSGLVMAQYQKGLKVLREAWGRALDRESGVGPTVHFATLAERVESAQARRSVGLGLHQVVLLAPMGLLFLGALSSIALFTLAIGDVGGVVAVMVGIVMGVCWMSGLWTIPSFVRDGNVDRLTQVGS
jgi:hypothetical protein